MHVLCWLNCRIRLRHNLNHPCFPLCAAAVQPRSGLRWGESIASVLSWICRRWPLDTSPAALSPVSCCVRTFTLARGRGKCLSVCHSLTLQWLGARREDESLGLMINWKCRKEMCLLSAEHAALHRVFAWGHPAPGCWMLMRK